MIKYLVVNSSCVASENYESCLQQDGYVNSIEQSAGDSL